MNKMTTTLLIACSISELITLTSYNSGVWVTDAILRNGQQIHQLPLSDMSWQVPVHRAVDVFNKYTKTSKPQKTHYCGSKQKQTEKGLLQGRRPNEDRFKRFPILHIIARQCLPAASCGRVLEVVAPVARAKGPPRTGVGNVAARGPRASGPASGGHSLQSRGRETVWCRVHLTGTLVQDSASVTSYNLPLLA